MRNFNYDGQAIAERLRQAPVVDNKAGLHPYRTGLCDGIFGRECSSPWKDEPFKVAKNAKYLAGYMRGEEIRNSGAGLNKRPSTCNH